jgi:hypothetical protein
LARVWLLDTLSPFRWQDLAAVDDVKSQLPYIFCLKRFTTSTVPHINLRSIS